MDFEKQERRQARKAFSRVHAGLVLFSLVASIVILVIQEILLSSIGMEGTSQLFNNPYFVWGLQVLSMYVIAFPIFLLVTRKLPSASREQSSMTLKEFGYIFLVSEAIMLIGSLFSNWIIDIIREYLDIPATNTTSELISNTPVWIIILVPVIIGPIIEELVFRKIIIDKLSIYGDRLAVLISSIAFGLFHGNLNQLFYATALGFVLGYVYTKTRRSIYNCLLHIAINFMGTIPVLLLPEVLMGQILFYMLLAGVITLIVATVKRSYRFSNERDIKIPLLRRPGIVLLNFGTIIFVVYFVANCFLSLFV